MKKIYREALFKLFEQELRKSWSLFKEITIPEKARIDKTEKAYGWKAKDGVTYIILLLPSLKGRDEFTCRVGWSTTENFPLLNPRHVTGSLDEILEQDDALIPIEFVCGQNVALGWTIRDEVENNELYHKMESGCDLTEQEMLELASLIGKKERKLTSDEAREVLTPFINDLMERLSTSVIPFFRKKGLEL